jgi:uncharacterized glyoxalase superfamily protein PhnB
VTSKAIPMFHVPDVDATVAWYVSIGFEVRDRFSGDGDGAWAAITFGESEVMLNSGGRPSTADRREVDLYLLVNDVDARFPEIAAKAEIVEAPHDTFYGMREFTVRDCNGFWITFGHPIADFDSGDGQAGSEGETSQ